MTLRRQPGLRLLGSVPRISSGFSRDEDGFQLIWTPVMLRETRYLDFVAANSVLAKEPP